MRIGIFADAHGNIYAFEKVWKALKKEKVDLYVFCGDICGYYYYQNAIIDILKDIKNLAAVRGNHDDIFLKMITNSALGKEYEVKYGRANSLLKTTIKKDNIEFLKKLPKKRILKVERSSNLAVFHGSPWDPLDEYIYPQDSIQRFKALKYRFILLGHTHYPMNREINKVRIINPGSCGQPRDFNEPSYAVLDTQKSQVKFNRISYNPSLLIKDILAYKEKNEYLVKILERRKDG